MLALVASRLIVILNTDSTLSLQTPHVCQCVIQVINLGMHQVLCAVNYVSGGKYARPENEAGTCIFASREYQMCRARRVVHRSYAKGQVRK